MKAYIKLCLILEIPLLLLAIIGNFISALIFNRKNLTKYSACHLYKLSCFSYIVSAITMFVPTIIILFDYDIQDEFFCKLRLIIYWSAISSWILAYISFDRMISIAYPKRLEILKKKNFHYLIIGLIIAYNFIVYGILAGPNQDIIFFNETNPANNASYRTLILCGFKTYEFFESTSIFDLINFSALPFTLMIVFSIISVITLFKNRKIINKKKVSKQEKARQKRDIRFAVTSISLNVIFLVFTLPFVVLQIIKDSLNNGEFDLLYEITGLLYVSGLTFNFLVYYTSNKLFRNEVNSILKVKPFLTQSKSSSTK